MLTTHPRDHEDLFDQADEPQRTGVARQPAQLDDQLIEVVGEVLAQRLHAAGRPRGTRPARNRSRRRRRPQDQLRRNLRHPRDRRRGRHRLSAGSFAESALLPAPSSSNDSYSSSSNSGMTSLLPRSPNPLHRVRHLARTRVRYPISILISLRFQRGTTHRRPSAGRSQAHRAAGQDHRLSDLPATHRRARHLARVRGNPRCPRQSPHRSDPTASRGRGDASTPRPLVVPILRAGLGMLEGMTRLIPTAEVGFVGLVRNEKTLVRPRTPNACP